MVRVCGKKDIVVIIMMGGIGVKDAIVEAGAEVSLIESGFINSVECNMRLVTRATSDVAMFTYGLGKTRGVDKTSNSKTMIYLCGTHPLQPVLALD
jgi:hypothetical protein